LNRHHFIDGGHDGLLHRRGTIQAEDPTSLASARDLGPTLQLLTPLQPKRLVNKFNITHAISHHNPAPIGPNFQAADSLDILVEELVEDDVRVVITPLDAHHRPGRQPRRRHKNSGYSSCKTHPNKLL